MRRDQAPAIMWRSGSGLPMPATRFPPISGKSLLQTLDQSSGVGWHSQQMRCLFESVVVSTGEQDRVASP